MNPFDKEVQDRITENGRNQPLREAASTFMLESIRPKYSYNFSWLGRPIIQYPQDMVAMQELVWAVQPDLIVETGIAHGGSLILYASLLELNAACGGPQNGRVVGIDIDIRAYNRAAIEAHPMRRRSTMIWGWRKGRVVGIDLDIRAYNRAAIEAHPMSRRITMIEGSSVDPAVLARVRDAVAGRERVLVCLDSNHTGSPVLAEPEAHAPMTSVG